MGINQVDPVTFVIQKIRALENLQSLSKHEQLVQGVLDAIDEGGLRTNAALPSVNTMISELGYARETIVKAYKELMERGVIASKNRKGYFVISGNIRQQQKVALLMYAFDTFQETLYDSLKTHIGKDIHIDLYFHHNNPDVFEAIFNRIAGHYGLYIVAPIPTDRIKALLTTIPPFKLLVIDRHVALGEDYSYITQEFRLSSYNVFQQLAPKLAAYDEIIFFFRKHTAEPPEILQSFRKFLKDAGLKGTVKKHYEPGSIEKNKVYFTIHNPELYAILKDVMGKKWKLGKDLAVLAHNDDVVKEIIAGGITTFSADFAEMGRLAANYVLTREKIQQVVPTALYLRKSL
ncbi:GntR family transcriptional regulator [Parapedobacter koreensis]|uniref:Transcriptional regulator, GntR family n=1 Tax=Parapedobacter koreensis TaxID=332977 RepID=A0A1H7SK34_9SPHI|nr:GntR family transcriptional regulator [Parapedobacter koreensis]SEL73010.1 transcriptional regulator, GntR family [Parapedobacter koreensis]